jgi:hypothetical protein
MEPAKMEPATHRQERSSLPVVAWAVVLGAAGFVAGFFGPMLLDPDANQGPMVGIFITGPAGVVLGALLGLAARWSPLAREGQARLLAGATVLGVVATLVSILPPPERIGRVVELEVSRCRPLSQADDAQAAASEDWDRRVAAVTWASPAPGWRDRLRATLQSDPGLLLDVTVRRADDVYRSRRPWSRGSLSASGFRPDGRAQTYYVRAQDGSCADYGPASQTVGFAEIDLSALRPGAQIEWPPTAASHLLGRETLQPVPAEYRALVGL